jgi:hypothetical protein
MKLLVVCYIYSSCLTHAISSLCRINQRHQTTLIIRPTLCRTSPTDHLPYLLNLVLIVKLIFVKLVILMLIYECW